MEKTQVQSAPTNCVVLQNGGQVFCFVCESGLSEVSANAAAAGVVVLRAFRSPAWALTYTTTTRGAMQTVYCTPTYERTHLTDSQPWISPACICR